LPTVLNEFAVGHPWEFGFKHCSRLESIIRRSKLEIIGESCFFNCEKLELALFPNDSRLVRIEKLPFCQCFFLNALSLPPLLELGGKNCFYGSSAFSTMTFSSPSRLRELLDIPVLWNDTVAGRILSSVDSAFLCLAQFISTIQGAGFVVSCSSILVTEFAVSDGLTLSSDGIGSPSSSLVCLDGTMISLLVL
jgi:hypothetical protein